MHYQCINLNELLLLMAWTYSDIDAYVNGSQLAKLKNSIPLMLLPWNLWGRSSWSKKSQLHLKNYNICKNLKFWAISWKINILPITAYNLNLRILLHMCHSYNCNYIFCTANFVSTKSIFCLLQISLPNFLFLAQNHPALIKDWFLEQML